MRYYGFNTRDYLILEHLPLNKDLALMEIGVGLGSTVDMIIGKVKEYCGVDIAIELIDWLKSLYKDIDSVSWCCLDVCKDSAFLNKKFDIVFSADTLEHVESAQRYFNFIKKHLKPKGYALITYPNESKDKHHGVTWFDNKEELLEIINKTGFEVIALSEVKKTLWHRIIEELFWEFPKFMILRNKKAPQSFGQTEAFKIARSTDTKEKMFAFYARAITKLAAVFPLYKYSESGENITNKNLLIHLKQK